MIDIITDYYNDLTALISSIRVTDKEGNKMNFYHGIEKVSNLITLRTDSVCKLMFIGNGASASISSHMAIDFSKNVGIRANAFNDSALLTCISNDYGYKHVFEKPIEMFADKGDILFAISSSGNSENILHGVKAAKSKKCKVVTLSGFDNDNPLSDLGDFNFYVPSQSYGHIEVIHHSICHCILDVVNSRKDGQK